MSTKEKLAFEPKLQLANRHRLDSKILNIESLAVKKHSAKAANTEKHYLLNRRKHKPSPNLVFCFSGFTALPVCMCVCVFTINGCSGAESVVHWLKGFIVNEDNTWPLMENLLPRWALVSI